MEYLAYGLLLVVGLIVFMQLRVLLAARKRQGQPAPDFSALLSAQQQGAGRLLLYFYTEHCGPCKSMAPHIDALAAQTGKVVKVDVAQHIDLARAFGVLGTPTVVVVQGGLIETMQVGGMTPAKLERLLQPPMDAL